MLVEPCLIARCVISAQIRSSQQVAFIDVAGARLDVPGIFQIIKQRVGHQEKLSASCGDPPGVFVVIGIQLEGVQRQADFAVQAVMGHAEWQLHHARQARTGLRAAPGQTSPDLVRRLSDVKAEKAGATLDGKTFRHASGDVRLMRGAKAKHGGLVFGVRLFPLMQAFVQQFEGVAGRCVVIVHQPDVLGTGFKRRLDADRITVGLLTGSQMICT